MRKSFCPALAKTNHFDWIFTAKKKNDRLDGDKITFEVNDLPGNETLKTQVL